MLDPTHCPQRSQATDETEEVVEPGQACLEEESRVQEVVACCQAWEEEFVGQMSLPHWDHRLVDLQHPSTSLVY